MPANPSTPEVMRADIHETMRLVEYDMVNRRRDGDGFIGERKEVAAIITALRDALSPARGGDELREALDEAVAVLLAIRAELGCFDGDAASLEHCRQIAGEAICRMNAALASTDMAGAGEGNSRPTSPLGHARACLRTAGETSHVQIRRVDLQWIIDRFPVCDPDTAPPVEGLTSGEGDRYADGYAQGQADAEQQHQWMQDKAWQDAVLMLVHYQTLAERTWLVGHEEAARKLAEWWKRAKALAYTKSVEEIAASPKATATASVRDSEAYDLRNEVVGFLKLLIAYDEEAAPNGLMDAVDNDGRPYQSASMASLISHARCMLPGKSEKHPATLTDSGTADTHAGSGEVEKVAAEEWAKWAKQVENGGGLRARQAVESINRILAALRPVDSRAQGGGK